MLTAVITLSILLFAATCGLIYFWFMAREQLYRAERLEMSVERAESRWEGTSAALSDEQDRSECQIAALQKNLDAAYTSLDLALQAVPGNFSNVATEIGLNGVVYQFHAHEVMKETIS